MSAAIDAAEFGEILRKIVEALIKACCHLDDNLRRIFRKERKPRQWLTLFEIGAKETITVIDRWLPN
jgi:hypothetical protein